MEWSPQQERALSAVAEWIREPRGQQVFKLLGHAGTGKTTLVMESVQSVKGDVKFASFTGKAASIMRSKGCPNAGTLHSLIYKPSEKSKDRLRNMQVELGNLMAELTAEYKGPPESRTQWVQSHSLVVQAQRLIRDEIAGLRKPSFRLNLESDLVRASLLVVDECSMVDEFMGRDILSFEKPVLVLGDPMQLPPIRGTGFFTEGEPDILLTEVHRQARDNPIIDLATRVREGEEIETGDYGESRVITLDEGEPEMYLSHDQVLVGRERKPEKRPDPVWRRNVNHRIRGLMGHADSVYPRPGEKVVCLRNNHDLGLLNGVVYHVDESQELDGRVTMKIRDGDRGLQQTVECHSKVFRGEELDVWEIKDAEHFDYGYAMTVHKAQGSQWPSVLVFDQSRIFRSESSRWLYTAITRAAERITVVKC